MLLSVSVLKIYLSSLLGQTLVTSPPQPSQPVIAV